MKRSLTILFLSLAAFSASAQGIRKTADEFNKMSAKDTSLVVLEGVVTKVRNTQRGTFYLKDATGEAYIYGLEEGRIDKKLSFRQMDIAPGDTVIVSGRRTVYNGSVVEMAGGHLLDKRNGPDHAARWKKLWEPDSLPTFQGRDPKEAFPEWVNSQLRLPKEAGKAGATGQVVVKFVVGTNGKLQEIEILESGGADFDEEALRVIRKSPKWKPAEKDGKPVRYTYRFPIVFGR